MKQLFFTVLLIVVSGCALAADQWQKYLGPNGNGAVDAPGLFGDEIVLDWIWVKKLGSGFSGVTVGGGKLYAMHTAGETDALSCFQGASGAKLWSYDYGPTFPKVGSSQPGPLSTPVLDGDRVYGLGAYGELFCLDANTGKLVWMRNIVKELGAVPREVGIGASPLVSGDFLILNVGDRKDKSIAAFHKKTGELGWHMGDETISFQSPALVTLLGRKQVVSLSDKKMRGIEPATGRVFWERDSREWLQTMAIGENLMLSGQYHGFALHHFADPGEMTIIEKLSAQNMLQENNTEKITITEKWYNQNITLEYGMPVHHKGYLYGFKGGSLICLKLETGEKVWSSREPGRGMVILVDGHLAIIGSDGVFRIVRASEKGYEERASAEVFKKSGITAPSYADGVFYMRNYTHLVAVRVKK